MSNTISSEITRISGAKEDIADAIEIKGVTVPSGSKIDDMADLILQINSGGGSGIVITETDDPAGGKVLEVTAVDLSDDTVRADKLVSGYTAHDSTGTAITGSLTPGITPTGTISINQNGTGIDVAQYAYANVSVSGGSPNLEDLTNIDPTESSQTITADTGYDGLNSVQINAISSTYVGSGIDRNDSTDLSVSGATVTAPAGYYASSASKSVSSGSATAPVSISGTGASVSTGSNTLTLSKTISVTPSVTAGYISSGTAGNSSVSLTATVNTRSSTDLSATGATVTAPAGYYASDATKSVSSMTLPTSASSSATSGYTSKATISRSTSDQYINIPTGYNSSGAYYKVNAVANGSVTAPSTISGSSATVSTGTNTLTLSKTVSVTPNVSTAGYISSGTAGNASVSLTASVTTKGAATITPTKSTQTIASGTYLTGTQTIAAIPNDYQDVTAVDAVAGDVVSGKKIVNSSGTVVTGSLVIQHYYTGSGAPSSSTGENGDIYLQTS